MAKVNLILTLRVAGDVDRTEFEPDAQWFDTPKGEAIVHQNVVRESEYLVGATGVFREPIADVLSDAHRFVMLNVDQRTVVL
jgi:hypothetical protein